MKIPIWFIFFIHGYNLCSKCALLWKILIFASTFFSVYEYEWRYLCVRMFLRESMFIFVCPCVRLSVWLFANIPHSIESERLWWPCERIITRLHLNFPYCFYFGFFVCFHYSQFCTTAYELLSRSVGKICGALGGWGAAETITRCLFVWFCFNRQFVKGS